MYVHSNAFINQGLKHKASICTDILRLTPSFRLYSMHCVCMHVQCSIAVLVVQCRTRLAISQIITGYSLAMKSVASSSEEVGKLS